LRFCCSCAQANCKKQLKTAFFLHAVFCLGGVAFALLSMNSEIAFSKASPVQILMFVTATLVFSPAMALIIINKNAAKASSSNAMLYLYIVCAQLVALAEIVAAGWHVITVRPPSVHSTLQPLMAHIISFRRCQQPYARMPGFHGQAWMAAVNLCAFGAGVNVLSIYHTYNYVLQSNRPKSS
jgi:hypothetical protein